MAQKIRNKLRAVLAPVGPLRGHTCERAGNCGHCNGTGWIGDIVCPGCNGSGG
ncbi:hypothetical protein ACFQ8W_00120 [Streptomyces sp. NPDC056508]|uniref:hypothetical protein n=1 Tax=Streptomyces sp. NPDC056508 TaxID=3345845 RepID=UPI003687A24B